MALKPFDTYMAESGRQSELDKLRRTFQYDAAKAEYERSGRYGDSARSSSTPSMGNFSDILKQTQNLISSQLQPITQQLESIKPVISQAYQQKQKTLERQLSSLSDRYQNLLDQITGRQQQETTTATRTTADELAKRGITGDSTLASQEIQRALDPIQRYYDTQSKEVQLTQAQEQQAIQDAIANVPIEQQLAEADVLKQIASIMAGGVNQATSLGSGLFNTLTSAGLQQQQIDQSSVFNELQKQLLQQQLDQAKVTNPLEADRLRAQIAQLNRSGSSISSDALRSLWSTL